MKLRIILHSVLLTLLSAAAIFIFQNCSATRFAIKSTDLSSNAPLSTSCIKDPTTNACLDLTTLSCQFNSSSVPANGVFTAYRSSNAALGESCISEQRHCVNGALSGSYPFPKCTTGGPASCLFNDVVVPHGSNVTAFQNSSVPAGGSCVPQFRQCTNGFLSNSFAYPKCTEGTATSSCRFGGRTYAHGEFVTAFLEGQVLFDQSCRSQTRQCLNGIMSGSYDQTLCTNGAAATCMFNGRTMASGESVLAFQTSAVPYGGTCAPQTRVCQNGVLDGSYNFSSCTQGEPKSCLVAGQQIASGEIIKTSLETIVPYGNTCSYQERKCTNGDLSGDARYTHLGCAQELPPPPVPPATPQCLQSEVLVATRSYIKHVPVAEANVIESCVDSANPTYQSNIPDNSDASAVRFFNTCGNRYCQQVLQNGFVEGRVIERNAGQVILECRRKDPPPTLSSACQQKFQGLPKPIVQFFPTEDEVASNCIDDVNPSLSDNLPRSAAQAVRFNYTCGTRWCKKNQFSSGRVVENNAGKLQVNCYKEEIFNELDAGTIASTTSSTINDVALLCQDEFNPNVYDSYPGRSTFSQLRFVNTCGNRFCDRKGLGTSGWVTEIQNNSAIEGLRTVLVSCTK